MLRIQKVSIVLICVGFSIIIVFLRGKRSYKLIESNLEMRFFA